jgi:cystathionine gamma-synthase
MGAEALRTAGISDQLLRLSVGLEDADDLIAGLNQGFAAIP